MKKALCIITALLCASVALSGCKSKDDGGEQKTYIDVDSDYSVLDSNLAQQLEMTATPLDTVVTDYKQDTLKTTGYGITFDDNYCYLYSKMGYWGDPFSQQALQCYTMNLQTGEIVSMCDVPGCTHDVNLYPNCINNWDMNRYAGFPTAVGDAIWDIQNGSSNKLVEKKGESETVIFENNYCTEYEEAYFQENSTQKYNISQFYVDDDYIYIFGPSYTYRVDRKTMKAQDPINISDDSGVMSPEFYNGKVYIGNGLQELFVIDYDTGEATKIADKVYGVQAYGDKLYFEKWEDTQKEPTWDDYNIGSAEVWDIDFDAYHEAYIEYTDSVIYTLCRMDLDGTGEEKVLDNCAFFSMIDGKIYYYGGTSKDRNMLKCYDVETKEDKVIYEDWVTPAQVFTAEHIDRIFVEGYVLAEGHEDYEYCPGINTDYVYSQIISFRPDGSDFWVVTVDGSDTIV